MSFLRKTAMNIVNQILDEAEVSSEKRNAVNDKCDAFVEQILIDVRHKAASHGWDESRLSFAAEIGNDITEEMAEGRVYKTKAEFLKALTK